MFTPNEVYSTLPLVELPYPDNLKVVGLTDRELGGVGLNDTSQGLASKVWTLAVVGNDVLLSSDTDLPSVLFSQPNIKDIALAFTQAMQPTVAWEDTLGILWLRYFNSVSQTYEVLDLGVGTTPRLTLDDKRLESSELSDIVVAYVRDTSLLYRLQRDRFIEEYTLKTDLPVGSRLEQIGMAGLRLYFMLSQPV